MQKRCRTFENSVRSLYEKRGWTVLHSGWPDFLCVRKREDGTVELKGVEAKSKTDALKPNQKETLLALSSVMEIIEVREAQGYGNEEDGIQELVYDQERVSRFERV